MSDHIFYYISSTLIDMQAYKSNNFSSTKYSIHSYSIHFVCMLGSWQTGIWDLVLHCYTEYTEQAYQTKYKETIQADRITNQPAIIPFLTACLHRFLLVFYIWHALWEICLWQLVLWKAFEVWALFLWTRCVKVAMLKLH